MLRLAVPLVLALLAAVPLRAEETLRLRMTEAMLAAGFDRHVLPRFRFRHRIALAAVGPGDAAEMALEPGGAEGRRVFSTADGDEVRLVVLSEDPAAAEAARIFRSWLTSTAGMAAVDGFAPDGTAPFTTAAAAPAAEAEAVEIDGDAARGADLALRHCGRCHVVDDRNRMGGIGSTPSFAALRGRPDWSALFLGYWAANPHPSFTQIAGLTAPFDPDRPVTIEPVELTEADVAAITAFVETLAPLDLGAPIAAN